MPFTVGATTFQLIKVLSNAGENKKSPSCTLGIESNHTLTVGKNPLVISIPNAAHMHNSQAPFFSRMHRSESGISVLHTENSLKMEKVTRSKGNDLRAKRVWRP